MRPNKPGIHHWWYENTDGEYEIVRVCVARKQTMCPLQHANSQGYYPCTACCWSHKDMYEEE